MACSGVVDRVPRVEIRRERGTVEREGREEGSILFA